MNKERPNAAHPPAPAGGSFKGNPPSDLELMMYFDGELDEPRRSEVESYVGADLGARGKLSGLRITSALVQRQTASLTAADDIADLVMAKLAANGTAAHPVPPAPVIAPAAPIQAPQLLPQPLPAPARPAANDNGRRIFVGLTALVAAAAAALAIWSRQPAGPSAQAPGTVHSAPATPPSPHAVEAKPVPAAPEHEIDAAVVSPEAEGEHGVEVAAVNFGAHMGSIFYVPSGSIEAKRTTTVVWLADDAGE